MTQRGKNIIAGVTCAVAVVVLAAIGLMALAPDIVHTREGNTRAYLRIYAKYVMQYRERSGAFPTTEQGLEQLVRDGYVGHGTFVDGWGNPVQYRYPSNRKGQPFELWSFGADGKPGGSGENADLEWKQ